MDTPVSWSGPRVVVERESCVDGAAAAEVVWLATLPADCCCSWTDFTQCRTGADKTHSRTHITGAAGLQDAAGVQDKESA
jgi:hypothetical protein